MEALGIPRGQYVVRVSNRKVLDGVMESIGLGGTDNAGRRLTVLRAIDKLDKVGVDGVRDLLGEGRWENPVSKTGDFTRGAGLSGQQIERIEKLYKIHETDRKDYFRHTPADAASNDDLTIVGNERLVVGSPEVLKNFAELFADSETAQEGIRELQEINNLVRSSGYGTNRVRMDVSVVRGLEYYTGPVYEVELLLETKDEKGRPVRFGSVGGGGRYDGLVSRFRGEPVPATGFSIGVSRLQAALTMLGKIDTTPEFGPVVVVVMDRNEIAQYQKFVATLRNAGIRAEMYLGNPKNNLGVQFKYADRRNSPCVVIQGGDEKAKGEVQIKDMIAGSALADASGSDRDEHLKEQAKAQVAVPEAKLVDEVRKVLARHQVNWK